MNDINNIEEIIPGISSSLKMSFEKFFSILELYNSKINLISKSTVSFAGVKHFADSYFGLKAIEDELDFDQPIFDFGSGNGFPGIIAGMMFSDAHIILVERDQRKAEFLKNASDQLGLSNIEVHSGSVSELADGSCKTIISRAMAPLPKFLLESRMVAPKGGVAYLFKGEHWSTEFSTIPAQLFNFWDVDLFASYQLPNDEGQRYIVKAERL